jgi:DNA polymerase V
MGAPYFKLKDEFRRHKVQVFSSNYALYADMSNRVMTTLEDMAPSVEIYSIDEAFMDLTGIRNCRVLEDYGREIRARVKRDTHLNVGVGIAPTKTLAKLANHAAKKWTKTRGVLDLSNIERQRRLMELVKVEDVWGVGRRISKKLNAMGIITAKDLSEQSTYIIRKHFNVVLERTVRELRGEPCLELEEFAPTKQQIVCSRSFGSRITEYQDMRQAVCAYAERAAEKLRSERQYCRQIAVFVRTSPHAVGETFYGNQAMGSLITPSNDTRDIIRVAMESLDRIWLDGCRFMKAGVMLGDFYSQGVSQLNLFDEFKPQANSETLMRVVDGLDQSGKGKLWFAGQGMQKTWAMKREMLSPAYTTRFSDLPVAR